MPTVPRLAPALLASLLAADAAHAARPIEDHPGAHITLADGAARANVRATFEAPAGYAPWQDFLTAAGGRWRVVWDLDTNVPLRIFGSGLDAPGAVEDPVAAERYARAVLERHVDLLAPRSAADDFVLASNVLSRGVRSVGFFQTQHGLRVEGGQVSFRFKHGRLVALGSEAFGGLDLAPLDGHIGAEQVKRNATKWLEAELGDAGRVEQVQGPRVRAFVLEDGAISARTVVRAVVWTREPLGKWHVDLDARTGQPFAREQTLRFAEGQLAYRVPERRPGAGDVDLPAALADVTVDGAAQRLDADGRLSWSTGATLAVQASVQGAGAVVLNEAGPEATRAVLLEDGATTVWTAEDDEHVAAQLTTFVHAYVAREYVRGIAPDLRFLNDPVEATVNINEQCNAFSDGTAIYFFEASNQCENTGRLPDVVHHEYGHSVHAHAIIPGLGSFDNALSEGISDYLAATIVDDAGMGRGFFYTDDPLRDLDPAGREWRWPEDQGESHQTGQIIGGALWDLREALKDTYGEAAGVRLVDGFWYASLERASSILAVYPELLVEDDDDGDLSNGTPNLCRITEIFQGAGLTDGAQAGLTIEAPQLDGRDIRMPLTATGLCPGLDFAGASVTWGRRGDSSAGGTLPMLYDGAVASATLPPQPEGQVLLFRVQVELTNGDVRSFPDNPADPDYEVFVGAVTPIYCTDFETDPLEAGWVSELLPSDSRRPRNEWEWGPPEGASGDPLEAYSGERVVGNDLSGNGRYQNRKSEQLLSPVIDVSGHDNVRLQYRRWLNVEDGDFDRAEILVGEAQVWQNRATGNQGQVHHEDREWRFHDVDLTDQVQNGEVQVTFRISSDEGASFGGWTIDDFCLVSFDGVTAVCGDGRLDFGEDCDDGNDAARDGCEADCTLTPPVTCGDGFLEGDEVCDDGNLVDGDGCEATCRPTEAAPIEAPGLNEDEGCRCIGGEEGGAFSGLLLVLGALAGRRRRR